jgi:hypothetical protein
MQLWSNTARDKSYASRVWRRLYNGIHYERDVCYWNSLRAKADFSFADSSPLSALWKRPIFHDRNKLYSYIWVSISSNLKWDRILICGTFEDEKLGFHVEEYHF